MLLFGIVWDLLLPFVLSLQDVFLRFVVPLLPCGFILSPRYTKTCVCEAHSLCFGGNGVFRLLNKVAIFNVGAAVGIFRGDPTLLVEDMQVMPFLPFVANLSAVLAAIRTFSPTLIRQVYCKNSEPAKTHAMQPCAQQFRVSCFIQRAHLMRPFAGSCGNSESVTCVLLSSTMY